MAHDERNHDLTPAERAAWAALSDERPAPPALEERIVRGLRRRGRLEPGPRRWIRPLGLAAAAGLIFAAGVGTGVTLPRPAARPPADAALEVQRAGTEYVHALNRLPPDREASADDAATQVALTTFYGAARELSRITGPQALQRHLAARAVAMPDSARGEPVIWF